MAMKRGWEKAPRRLGPETPTAAHPGHREGGGREGGGTGPGRGAPTRGLSVCLQGFVLMRHLTNTRGWDALHKHKLGSWALHRPGPDTHRQRSAALQFIPPFVKAKIIQHPLWKLACQEGFLIMTSFSFIKCISHCYY